MWSKKKYSTQNNVMTYLTLQRPVPHQVLYSKFYVLSTQCTCVLFLRKKRPLFPHTTLTVRLYNPDGVCLQRGTRPIFKYSSGSFRYLDRSHVRRLQVLQSKRRRIATGPRQNHSREFRLIVKWCGEPLSSATWRMLALTEGWPKSPEAQAKGVEG